MGTVILPFRSIPILTTSNIKPHAYIYNSLHGGNTYYAYKAMERLSTLSIVADEIGDFLNTDNIFKRFLTLLLFISFEHDKNIHNIDTTLQIDGKFRYFSPPTGSLSLSPLHIDIISGKKRVARAWRRRPR